MSKLFIGNIPHASSEQDLQAWIEANGVSVENTEIIRDRSTGNPRGFGFVVLKEDAKLRDAIETLNGKKMGGRVLTVSEATPIPRIRAAS